MQRLIAMSEKELNILKTIEKITSRQLTMRAGADLLGMSTRNLRYLKKAYLAFGPDGLISKKRGKTNHRHSSKLKIEVMSLIEKLYQDYGPTLAAEKLNEHHDIMLCKETVRRWMIENGLWSNDSKVMKNIHQPRNRRPCFGELIQMDGSDHNWFEGRAERCTLLVAIDDATSTLLGLRFVSSENTQDYLCFFKSYVLAHGKPKALYVDKHNVFRVNHIEARSGDGLTQFGRVLKELNIDINYANSPQAKGRVERANRTLQDRLVKELRYHQISSMESANIFLEDYIKRHNKKFSRIPEMAENVHVKLTSEEINEIEKTFSIQSRRVISNNLTISYQKTLLLIQSEHPNRLKGQEVLVCEQEDKQLVLYQKGEKLMYKILKKYDYQEKVMGIRQVHYYLTHRFYENKLQKEGTGLRDRLIFF